MIRLRVHQYDGEISIRIERIGPDEQDRWNEAVERSPQTNPFHRFEALQLLARTSDSQLIPLMGFRGEEPFGLFPLFEYVRGPLRIVRSPRMSITVVSNLGPALLNHEKLKQRKAEKYNRRFVDACLDLVDANVDPDRVEVRTTPRYPDARPFLWRGFDVEVDYTYIVDLSAGADAAMERFSSEARRKIRNSDDARYEIRAGGTEEIRTIIRQLRSRLDGHEERYGGTGPRFPIELYEALPEGRVRPYVCEVDGEYAGGGITLESADTVYRWLGFSRPQTELPVNELLDWYIMQGAEERDKDRYDFVGARSSRLAEYKAKFAPDIVPSFIVRWDTRRMRAAATAHEFVTDGIDAIATGQWARK